MDLSTTYLGLKLDHPLMPGASPLADDLDTVRRLEDAGAAAIVMRSLFEEQLTSDQPSAFLYHETLAEATPEATSYLPRPYEYALDPHEYLEQLRHIRRAVAVPVIASLNGVTPSGWLKYAGLIEDAGASALEVNVYGVPSSVIETAAVVEHRVLEAARLVVKRLSIPVAVKLSPFYTSLPHFAAALEAAGVHGLVLFNRFYQPDFDLEALTPATVLHLSNSSELLLRLRWTAMLFGRVRTSLAVSGGVHEPTDVVKAIMAGADAVQTVSALLERGPHHLADLRTGLERWMEAHEYESVTQMRGSLSFERSPDAYLFERANYIRILQSWRLPSGANW